MAITSSVKLTGTGSDITITATDSSWSYITGTSGDITVESTHGAITRIALTPAAVTIVTGASQQFIATGTYSDSTTGDITSSATWNSTNPGVATVNSSSLAIGVSPGYTVIYATQGGVTSSYSLLTVDAATPATVNRFSGNNQTAYVGTAFATPLSVQVLDASNVPIPGLTVSFAAPSSGASLLSVTARPASLPSPTTTAWPR
jgi:hypothetical protein